MNNGLMISFSNSANWKTPQLFTIHYSLFTKKQLPSRIAGWQLSYFILYFAFGPAAAMCAGIFGYFFAKFSENIVASLFACAS